MEGLEDISRLGNMGRGWSFFSTCNLRHEFWWCSRCEFWPKPCFLNLVVGASVWDYMMTLMKEVLCGGMAVMSSCQLFCCIGSSRLQTTVTEKVSRMTGLSDALCTPDGLWGEMLPTARRHGKKSSQMLLYILIFSDYWMLQYLRTELELLMVPEQVCDWHCCSYCFLAVFVSRSFVLCFCISFFGILNV